MFYLDVLLLSLIVCFIIDISGFMDSVKHMIWKWLFGNKREYREFPLKPFDCSLCMTFWVGLIWCFGTAHFQLYHILFVCLMSMLSEQISNMLRLLRMMLQKVEDMIFNYLMEE